jgi:uncharacterized membrane protein (UPF0127 family)
VADIKRIAEKLFKEHPQVVERGARRLPFMVGDVVTEDAVAGVMPHSLIGRIAEIRNRQATVKWNDGSISQAPTASLTRIYQRYEQPLPDVRIAVRVGEDVVLGNGDHGRVVKECCGPTGFYSYRIEITKSINKMSVGRHVYATEGALNWRSAGMLDLNADVSRLTDTLRHDAQVVFSDDSEWRSITCEVASTPRDQVIGLQKVSAMPRDCGMVFPYDPPRDVSFHMGTVGFPIDMVFVSAGRVARVCGNIQPGTPGNWGARHVSAVVELPGGLCEYMGVTPGLRVGIQAIRMAQRSQPYLDANHPDVMPVPRAPSMFNDRFKDRGLVDQQVEDQPASPGHFEQNMGFDPEAPNDQAGSPAFRPAHKVEE